jgi:hypothetical protein
MGFASSWLHSRRLFPDLLKEAPHQETGIIVVVPSFDEPDINRLLDSLDSCEAPECRVEVIIVVNAPSSASGESLINNLITVDNLRKWKEDHHPFFSLYTVDLGQPPIKGWGVGLARRAGMDEALRRFDIISRPEGIIVSLDADCLVSRNYFVSLESELLNRKERTGCSVAFEHPLTGCDFTDEIYEAVIQYELHLRYYNYALKFCGFPYVYHTIGSAIAVKALSYVKAGGMNRRQAGEDFYFIQKLTPAGGYFSLDSATVFPSPRISARVPFGTGPAIEKMLNGAEKGFLTYNPLAFSDLKTFFEILGKTLFSGMSSGQDYSDFPDSIRSFIDEEEWKGKIAEISENTSGAESFRKRFFEWFNMFKVPVLEAISDLLQRTGQCDFPCDAYDMLLYLRRIERGN